MKITIETIPHKNQRYETVGDWYWTISRAEQAGPLPKGEIAKDEEVLIIRVSELSDWRREALIAVHELVEVLLCKHNGVTQEQVDRFDMKFEENRAEGNVDEPGDDPNAPYSKEHCIATAVERLLAANLDVPWSKYADEVESL